MKAASSLAKYRAATSRINSEPDLGYLKETTILLHQESISFASLCMAQEILELWITFTWAFFFQVCREPCQLHEGCFTFLKLFFKFNCPFFIIKQALIGWPRSCVQFQVTWDRTTLDQKVFEVPQVVYRTKKQTEEFTFYTMVNLQDAKVTYKTGKQIRIHSHMVIPGILSVMTCKVFSFPINFPWVVP